MGVTVGGSRVFYPPCLLSSNLRINVVSLGFSVGDRPILPWILLQDWCHIAKRGSIWPLPTHSEPWVGVTVAHGYGYPRYCFFTTSRELNIHVQTKPGCHRFDDELGWNKLVGDLALYWQTWLEIWSFKSEERILESKQATSYWF